VVGLTVAPCSDAVQVAGLLDSPEIAQLVDELEATRWTGRPGYPIRAMIGMALAKHVYTLPTWTRAVALVREHAALRMALGCPDVASVPSVHACYRFAAKLRAFKPLLDACLDRVTAALHEQIPELGATVAIDASDLPAYGNGQRYVCRGGPERKRFADPDASWGHRSVVSTRAAGSFYGYKLHQAVCAETGLPLAWEVATAKAAESTFAVPLLDAVKARGFRPEVAVLDMGYDHEAVYAGCEERGCHPVIPAAGDPRHQGRQAPPAYLRARHLDIHWFRRQAPSREVALSFGRVLPGQPVGRSQPAPHPDPARHGPVEEALPAARRGRAGERPPQARVGPAAPTGPPSGAGPAPRRPDHPGPARGRARQGPSGAAGRIGGYPQPRYPQPRGFGLPGDGLAARSVSRMGYSAGRTAHEPRRSRPGGEFRWPYRRTLLGQPGYLLGEGASRAGGGVEPRRLLLDPTGRSSSGPGDPADPRVPAGA
jgi:hypothetical protein